MRAQAERKRPELVVQHTQKMESLGVLAGGIAHTQQHPADHLAT